jgi:hypothetical protein
MSKEYTRGYQAGYRAGKRHQKSEPNDRKPWNPSKPVGYGLTEGQIRMIKTQVEVHNSTYEDLAEHYKVPVNSIRMVVESIQFADIKPIKTKQELIR